MLYAHLLTEVARDDNVDDAWAFVCSFYGIGDKYFKGIDDTRHVIPLIQHFDRLNRKLLPQKCVDLTYITCLNNRTCLTYSHIAFISADGIVCAEFLIYLIDTIMIILRLYNLHSDVFIINHLIAQSENPGQKN